MKNIELIALLLFVQLLKEINFQFISNTLNICVHRFNLFVSLLCDKLCCSISKFCVFFPAQFHKMQNTLKSVTNRVNSATLFNKSQKKKLYTAHYLRYSTVGKTLRRRPSLFRNTPHRAKAPLLQRSADLKIAKKQ